MTNHDFSATRGTGPFAFTLRDAFAIGFRHKRVLVLCFGGVLLGTLAAAILMPPNYHAGDKLPAIAEAYPLEFTDSSLAGEVTGS